MTAIDLIPTFPCLCAAFFLAGCESVSDGLETSRDQVEIKELLSAGAWKPSGRTISPGFDVDEDGDADENLYPLEKPCSHDDVMTFGADWTWQIDEGPLKCEAGEPQVETGTWELNGAGDGMRWDGNDGSAGPWVHIESLSGQVFSVSLMSADWKDGKSRKERYTWRSK